MPPITQAAGVIITGFVFCLPMGIYQGLGFDWSAFSETKIVSSTMYYALFIWAAAYILWYYGIEKVPATFGQEYLHMKVAEHLISLLQVKSGLRIVVVGGAGSLAIDDKGTLVMDSANVPPEVRHTAAAQGQVLNRLKQANDVNWTFISPSAMFAPGERTGKYRIGSDRLLIDTQGQSHISMEDYAIALVNELENPQYISQFLQKFMDAFATWIEVNSPKKS